MLACARTGWGSSGLHFARLPLVGSVGIERQGMHATREFALEARVDRTMPLYKRFAREVRADQYDAEVCFGAGAAPVPGTLIQNL